MQGINNYVETKKLEMNTQAGIWTPLQHNDVVELSGAHILYGNWHERS